MQLDAPADPTEEERASLDALGEFCEHYDVAPDSRYVHLDAPADRVHYLTAGSGPPLVLLHGLASTAHVWVPLFDRLTDEFTVYAPTRPGRGLSTPVDHHEVWFREFGVRYVVQFLDALDLDAPAVLANSLGGLQALALADDHPDRVSQLCLVGAPVGLSRSVPLAFRLFDLPVVGRWLFDSLEPATVAQARRIYRQMSVEDDSAIPDGYFDAELRAAEIPGQRESLWSLLETLGTVRGLAPEYDLREALRSVETPTRFVWGTEDYFWPPDAAHPTVEEMPDADLMVLDGHGHMPWLEPGDAAEDACLDFLADAP